MSILGKGGPLEEKKGREGSTGGSILAYLGSSSSLDHHPWEGGTI